MPITEAQKKIQELILYLCRRSEGDEKFGLTKLNKLLFFSDFMFYAKHHTSITEQSYRRLPQGPAPLFMKQILDSMIASGDVEVLKRDYYGHAQQKPYAKREPDLSDFSGEEIAIVDAMLELCKPFSGSDVSEISHRFPGWQLVGDNQVIPYQAVYIDRSPLSQEDIEYAATIDMSGVKEFFAANA